MHAQSCPTLCNYVDHGFQAHLSMEFSKQEYWRDLPFPPPGDLPNSGTESAVWNLLHWQADSLPLHHLESPLWCWILRATQRFALWTLLHHSWKFCYTEFLSLSSFGWMNWKNKFLHHHIFFFWSHCVACSVTMHTAWQDLSFHAFCIRSTEPSPLEHQGSPSMVYSSGIHKLMT